MATEDGLLVTTAHLATPWGYESPARVLVERGFTPVMHRQLGYLPGLEAPFDVELALASGEADLAVLRSDAGVAMSPLALGDTAPEPGEDVIVLGYPTGLRALLARTSPQAVDSVMADSEQTFWSMARRLAEGGHIQPLATRGIVGQVTSTTVVYDAVTTHGAVAGQSSDSTERSSPSIRRCSGGSRDRTSVFRSRGSRGYWIGSSVRTWTEGRESLARVASRPQIKRWMFRPAHMSRSTGGQTELLTSPRCAFCSSSM